MTARLACATAPVGPRATRARRARDLAGATERIADLGEAQFGLIVELVERTAQRLRPTCAAMSDERFDALVREAVDVELRRLGDHADADGGARVGR